MMSFLNQMIQARVRVSKESVDADYDVTLAAATGIQPSSGPFTLESFATVAETWINMQ